MEPGLETMLQRAAEPTGDGASPAAMPAAQAGPVGHRRGHPLLVGAMLGFMGAGAALIFNVMGSVLLRQHPLELIRVYLTFPLGAAALEIQNGPALTIGCGLYMATGALFGILFHTILNRHFAQATSRRRFAVATVLGCLLWFVNYHVLLAQLQPALVGGNWIVDMVPTWVAVLTHLVFAWTLYIVDEWGTFQSTAPVLGMDPFAPPPHGV